LEILLCSNELIMTDDRTACPKNFQELNIEIYHVEASKYLPGFTHEDRLSHGVGRSKKEYNNESCEAKHDKLEGGE